VAIVPEIHIPLAHGECASLVIFMIFTVTSVKAPARVRAPIAKRRPILHAANICETYLELCGSRVRESLHRESFTLPAFFFSLSLSLSPSFSFSLFSLSFYHTFP